MLKRLNLLLIFIGVVILILCVYHLNVKLSSQLNELQRSAVINMHKRISQNEFKVYSQNGEDGVIGELIKMFDLNQTKYYVEIGTQSGQECNSRYLFRYLREKLDWKGIMFDGVFGNEKIGLYKETITHQNVLDIFEKYSIDQIGILSEDTDYADYWIVEAILGEYSPKVVVHEVNQQPPDMCVTVPKTNAIIFWDQSEYHGANVCAFHCLAQRFGYTMVYCESVGVNCFWVRNDLVESYLKVNAQFVQRVLTPKFLFRKLRFSYLKTNKSWHIIKC